MLQALVLVSQVKWGGKEFNGAFKICVVYFLPENAKVVKYYLNIENSRRDFSFTIHNSSNFWNTLPFLRSSPREILSTIYQLGRVFITEIERLKKKLSKAEAVIYANMC